MDGWMDGQQQIQKINLIRYICTTQKQAKRNGQIMSSLGQESTFKVVHRAIMPVLVMHLIGRCSPMRETTYWQTVWNFPTGNEFFNCINTIKYRTFVSFIKAKSR